MNKTLEEDLEFISKNIKLNELKNKSIFITGATGFFGKLFLNTFNFLNKKLNLNTDITILTRSFNIFINEYPEFKNIKYIEGDIRDFNIQNKNYDYLIHAATPASEKLEKENPNEMYSIIIDGSKHIIEMIKKCSVKRLLFTSSGAVYNQPPNIKKVGEDYKGTPLTAYARGKKESENMFLNIDNSECVIARCFAFVGLFLNLDIHFAIGNFIRDCINKNNIIIKGDGRPYRSYLYTADLMIWLINILTNAKDKSIYNVGSNKEISIFELAKIVAKQYKHKTEIKVLTKTDNSTPPPIYVPDNSKIIQELKVKENYSLEESIKRTILWNKGV